MMKYIVCRVPTCRKIFLHRKIYIKLLLLQFTRVSITMYNERTGQYSKRIENIWLDMIWYWNLESLELQKSSNSIRPFYIFLECSIIVSPTNLGNISILKRSAKAKS